MATVAKSKLSFPRAALEKYLGNWWDKKKSSPFLERKTPEECREKGGKVWEILPELSSNQAVPVLLELESILGFEPSKDVIRRGGYRSRSEFISDMCSKIEAEHTARLGKPARATIGKETRAHA